MKLKKSQIIMSKTIEKIKNNYIPILLFSLALLLRSLALNVPYGKYDEDIYVNMVGPILSNPLNPMSPDPTIWATAHGPIFPYLSALTVYLFGDFFGDPYVSIRIIVAIIGSISVLVIYYLGKRLFGKTIGIMTGLLMAVNPEHWSGSMQAITDIPFFLLLMCSIYFIYVGIEDNKNNMLLMGGVLAGLSVLTSYTGFLLLPIFFFYLVLTGRFSYFITKKIFSSVVIVPSLLLVSWLYYMSLNPGSNYGTFAVSTFLTFNSYIPRYQFFGNFSVLLLIGVFPLSLLPYIGLLKNYFSKKYISLLIILYIIAILAIKLLLPDDLSLHGTEVLLAVESILDNIHPILFTLSMFFLYVFSILALVGFFIEVYTGTKYKRNEYTLLACWVAMILMFVVTLPLTYPRYLLPIVPAFLMVISLEIESFSAINKKSKQISYIFFMALFLVFLTIGIFKAFSF